jgi:hypothetical protein
MNDSVTYDTPEADLFAIPDLRLDLLSRPPLTDFRPYTTANFARGLRVPAVFAEFFIECFAVDEPRATLHRRHKVFPRDGAVLKFQLPAVLPIVVKPEGKTVTFHFVDTPLLGSIETEQIVKRLLNVLSSRSLFVAKLERIDARSFAERIDDIDSFAVDLDIRLLFDVGSIDRNLEVHDVTFFVIKSHWDGELERDVRESIAAFFDRTAVNYCSKCRLLFAPGDGEGCFETYHRGRQIPFENGNLEEVDWNEEEDGEPVTLVKYTCCGEVAKDDPGCERMPAGVHNADQERPFSRISYYEIAFKEANEV